MEEHSYGFKPEFLPSPPYPSSPNLSYPNYHPPSGSEIYPLIDNNPHNIPNFNHPQISTSNRTLAFRWVESSTAYGSVPPCAVHGGTDADGEPIYVGRAHHDGDLIPAKVIPGKNAAYVAHNGEEHLVENYQLLCRQDFEWIPCSGGHVPPGAVQGGHTCEGEPLYIGRSFYEGSHTIGKIHRSHGVCYIPFGGQEIACPDYEALVVRC